MRVSLIICFLIAFSMQSFSQDEKAKVIDSLYKEDQFYAGVTYNILGNKPTNVSQTGFSLGFHLGFIKDMPINTNRNVAIGVGIGYSANTFNHNLQISKDNIGGFKYSVLNDGSLYSRNKFSQHLVEFPLEFRWRTSNAVKYDFWRIYTGFKFSYVFANTSKYVGKPESLKFNGIDAFNKFQYGLTFSAGYNTWNFYVYYALNPIFLNDANLTDGNDINMKAIKIGLMFYIL